MDQSKITDASQSLHEPFSELILRMKSFKIFPEDRCKLKGLCYAYIWTEEVEESGGLTLIQKDAVWLYIRFLSTYDIKG